MKNDVSAPSIRCRLFGHTYKISKQITLHVKEYICKSCSRQVTTNGRGNLTVLTPMYKEINSVLERIYKRRELRRKLKLSLGH